MKILARFTRRVLVPLVILALIILGVGYTFGYVVNPGEMGVRQITMPPKQGFSRVALDPGYHWSIPGYSKIYFIPRTLQVFHFERGQENELGSTGYLEVQTTDGPSVYVDLSLLYRYYNAPADDHGGPADLITKVGTTQESWTNRLRTVADNQLKEALGRLSTSEFYNPYKREEQVLRAKEEMNQRLRPYGMTVESVLLRRYTYPEDIDQAIRRKNLQVQEERLNVAKRELAKAQAQTEEIAAEGDRLINNLLDEGENNARVTRSEGQLYEAEKRAQGDLLVAKAEAEVERLRASALSSSRGADIFVARELAKILGSLKGGVVSDIDPYDLQEWIKRFGVEEGRQ